MKTALKNSPPALDPAHREFQQLRSDLETSRAKGSSSLWNHDFDAGETEEIDRRSAARPNAFAGAKDKSESWLNRSACDEMRQMALRNGWPARPHTNAAHVILIPTSSNGTAPGASAWLREPREEESFGMLLLEVRTGSCQARFFLPTVTAINREELQLAFSADKEGPRNPLLIEVASFLETFQQSERYRPWDEIRKLIGSAANSRNPVTLGELAFHREELRSESDSSFSRAFPDAISTMLRRANWEEIGNSLPAVLDSWRANPVRSALPPDHAAGWYAAVHKRLPGGPGIVDLRQLLSLANQLATAGSLVPPATIRRQVDRFVDFSWNRTGSSHAVREWAAALAFTSPQASPAWSDTAFYLAAQLELSPDAFSSAAPLLHALDPKSSDRVLELLGSRVAKELPSPPASSWLSAAAVRDSLLLLSAYETLSGNARGKTGKTKSHRSLPAFLRKAVGLALGEAVSDDCLPSCLPGAYFRAAHCWLERREHFTDSRNCLHASFVLLWTRIEGKEADPADLETLYTHIATAPASHFGWTPAKLESLLVELYSEALLHTKEQVARQALPEIAPPKTAKDWSAAIKPAFDALATTQAGLMRVASASAADLVDEYHLTELRSQVEGGKALDSLFAPSTERAWLKVCLELEQVLGTSLLHADRITALRGVLSSFASTWARPDLGQLESQLRSIAGERESEAEKAILRLSLGALVLEKSKQPGVLDRTVHRLWFDFRAEFLANRPLFTSFIAFAARASAEILRLARSSLSRRLLQNEVWEVGFEALSSMPLPEFRKVLTALDRHLVLDKRMKITFTRLTLDATAQEEPGKLLDALDRAAEVWGGGEASVWKLYAKGIRVLSPFPATESIRDFAEALLGWQENRGARAETELLRQWSREASFSPYTPLLRSAAQSDELAGLR